MIYLCGPLKKGAPEVATQSARARGEWHVAFFLQEGAWRGLLLCSWMGARPALAIHAGPSSSPLLARSSFFDEMHTPPGNLCANCTLPAKTPRFVQFLRRKRSDLYTLTAYALCPSAEPQVNVSTGFLGREDFVQNASFLMRRVHFALFLTSTCSMERTFRPKHADLRTRQMVCCAEGGKYPSPPPNKVLRRPATGSRAKCCIW